PAAGVGADALLAQFLLHRGHLVLHLPRLGHPPREAAEVLQCVKHVTLLLQSPAPRGHVTDFPLHPVGAAHTREPSHSTFTICDPSSSISAFPSGSADRIDSISSGVIFTAGATGAAGGATSGGPEG